MTEKVDITQRILETRKQTEELKAQLQSLIDTGKNVDSGFHSGIVNSIDGSSGGKESLKSSPNKVQIIRSFDAQHSNHTNKPQSSKNIPKVQSRIESNINKKDSPRKIRSYDVEEARQYIKKQREKRLEQLKAQNEEKCRIENQKKKLQELHKKSLELVSKNVQAKRERSKSRDKNIYVRPQENQKANTNARQTRSRSVSRERRPQNTADRLLQNNRSRSNTRVSGVGKKAPESIETNQMQPRNPNLLYPPLPDYMQRKNIREKEKTDNDKVETKVESHSNHLHSQGNDLSSGERIVSRELETSNKPIVPVNLFKSPKGNDEKSRPKGTGDISKETISAKGNVLVANEIDDALPRSKNNPINLISNVTIRSAFMNDQNENDDKHEGIANKANDLLFDNTVNVSKHNLEQYTKETQTPEVKKEFPKWLEEQPAQAYPFNFINTVKRKLQYTINSPKPSIDIGVQSSLMTSTSPNADVEQLKTREQLRELIQESTKSGKHSDTKSFLSHKHPNLDPKSIDHLELIPKMESNKKYSRICEIDSRTVIKSTDTGSESDTSKNIPEISSESGTSLKKNAESVRKHSRSEVKRSINTDKLDSMKLIPQRVNSNVSELKHSIENVTNDGTEKNIKSKISENTKSKPGQIISIDKELEILDKICSFSVENEYTSDFHSGSELDLSNDESAKRRESIIAFNSPTYNKQHVLLSPEYLNIVPSIKSSSNVSSDNDKNIKFSSSEASTTSNKSKHSKNIPLTVSTTSNLDVVPENTHSNKEDQNIKEELTTIYSSSDPKVTSKNSASLKQFTSLHSNFHPSQSINDQLSKSDINLHFVNTRRGTGNNSRSEKSEILPLKAPSVFLIEPTIAQTSLKDNNDTKKLTKNVCLRSNISGPAVDTNSTNEIHLKFEAEIHLLNDFNESLRQFSAVEKVFETLKTKNELTSSKILQNQDTQTSVMTKPSTKSTKSIETGGGDTDKSFISGISTINYSRGSFVDPSMDDEFKIFENSALKPESNSLISTRRDSLPANVTNNSSIVRSENLSNFENVHSSNFAGLSLNMFEQLIKDEDARLENLKTILKIREQVLLDRTKGELAWLEIQRKHFKETGQLHEASVIKKKQRGILVNHQKEKHEMQRLKQMQKAASLERKIVLKEQRNLIRQQLSTDSMLKKMKVSTLRDRRLSGPLKVIQNHTESIRSETSISKRSSTDREKEVLSITSHHSIVSKVSEISEVEVSSRDALSESESIEQQKIMKRTLLMREETLKKRKKAAEELLQWHKKLLEEEKRIAELESTANAMISQTPTASKQLEKYKFKGKQLNQLWYNLTGCEKKKFIEDKIYPMSQMALERFCKSAREYSTKTKKLLRRNNSDSEAKIDSSVSESIPEQKDSQTISVKEASDSSMLPKNVPTNDYVSDFDVESLEDIVNNDDIDVVDQSINLLIDNFSKIKEDISARGSNHSKHSDEEIEITEEISKDSKFEKSESEAEISVIETNKASKESELKSSSHDDKLEETNHTAGSQIITQRNSQSLEVAEESDLSENNETGKQISSKEMLVSDSKVSTEIDEKIEAKQDAVMSDVEESLQVTERESADLDSPMYVKSKLPAENSETITQPSAISSEVKDTLNESKEILLMLGGVEVNDVVDLSDEGKITNNLSASADILSRLSQVITDPLLEKKSDIETNSDLQDSNHVDEFVQMSRGLESKNVSEETLPIDKIGDISSESLELLLKISDSNEKIQSEGEGGASLLHTSSNDVLLDTSVPEDVNEESDKSVDKITADKSVSGEVIDENSAGSSKAVTPELEQPSLHSVNRVTADVVSGLEVSDHEISKINSDEDILTNKSNDISKLNIPVNEVVSPSTDVHSPTEAKSVIEEIHTSPSNSEGSSDKSISNLSYGIIEAARSSEVDNIDKSVDDKKSEPVTTKEDINSFEEKELDSLSSLTNSGSPIEKVDSNEKSTISTEEGESNDSIGEPSGFKTKDVRKRVSEIMAEANQTSKGDKSPRMQDIYVTTYDLISPASSPESLSPISNDTKYLPSTSIFGSEAEELLKKQLAIEQEIKAITDQQKKEQQTPLLFVREIPNKPPPPYTPPSSLPTGNTVTIIPTPGEIEEIAKYSSKILYKARVSKNLENICISEKTLSLISKDITKECYKFVFDLCKEIAKEHYQQFEEEKGPAWLCSSKKNKLAVVKPLDVNGLESYMIKKLRELFVYEKPIRRENTIIKWSRKKRDHVDEILVMESQSEEAKWTNYNKDELLVISQITDEIMNSLLKETGEVLNDIFLRHT